VLRRTVKLHLIYKISMYLKGLTASSTETECNSILSALYLILRGPFVQVPLLQVNCDAIKLMKMKHTAFLLYNFVGNIHQGE
jgi:hypothetical protein